MLGRLNMRMKTKKKAPKAEGKKRSASDYGDQSDVTSFDEFAGGVFEEDELYNGVDEMMPDEALDAKQAALMDDLFDFDMFDKVDEGEEMETAHVHSMRNTQDESGSFNIDDLF